MSPDFPLSRFTGVLLTYFLLAFFAGGIRAAMQPTLQPLRLLLAHSMGCGLAGFCVGLACFHFLPNTPPFLPLLFVTIAGWSGPAIVERIAEVAIARVSGQFNQQRPPGPPGPPAV